MKNDKLSTQLLQMKEQANAAADEAAQLKGRLQEIERALKEEYNCQTLDEAKELFSKLEEKAAKLEEEIRQQVTEIKNEYDF